MVLRILVTGFEPFGGYTQNPSAEVALALDGAEIGGARVSSRILPVDFARYRGALDALLRETAPVLYLGFGLYAGEDKVRIERTGVNLADFDMPDNAGVLYAGLAIEAEGPPERKAAFPCDATRDALRDAGIPARISDSAGTFLCNATLYSALGSCGGMMPAPLCGFIHLPHATHHVAALQAPTMAIETMIEAARIAIGVALTQPR